MIVFPIIAIIIFNIVTSFYCKDLSKKELINISDGVERFLSRQQFASGFLDANQRYINLKGALKLSSLSENTDFLLISSNGEIIFPKTFENSFLSLELIEKAKKQLADNGDNEISEFYFRGEKFYALSKIASSERVGELRFIYISSPNYIKNIVFTINLILIILSAISIISGVFLTMNVSRSISKPISMLSKQTENLIAGEMLQTSKFNDCIEIYKLTESINYMSKRIQDHNNSQKAFLVNASHELRTPLMSIQGYAEGIANGLFKDAPKTAEIIIKESLRLKNIVDDLLLFSRIENNDYEHELEMCNLSDVMKEYIQRINGYAIKENKKIVFTTEYDNIPILINNSLLAQAMINIISNAIRFSKEVVTVSLEYNFKEGIIHVKDDGDGIAEEDIPYVFDRLYKGKKGNYGLGLAIAKLAVETMNGSIKAYNDNGAVIEIKLNQGNGSCG